MGHWEAGTFYVGEGFGQQSVYFDLKWLMWGRYDDRLVQGVRRYIVDGIAKAVILHLCHTVGERVDGAGNRRRHVTPHVCTDEELAMVQRVRSLCRELRVQFSIENCCPQIRTLCPTPRPGDAPNFCDMPILRDCSWCPCCTGDCMWAPDEQSLSSLAGEDSGHRFREDF